jgi:hypothetical protein
MMDTKTNGSCIHFTQTDEAPPIGISPVPESNESYEAQEYIAKLRLEQSPLKKFQESQIKS